MSYANMVLYGAVLPSYRSKDRNEKDGKGGKRGKRKGGGKEEVIRADDRRNKEKVRQFFENID